MNSTCTVYLVITPLQMKETTSYIKQDLNIPLSLRAAVMNTGYFSASHTKEQQKSQSGV